MNHVMEKVVCTCNVKKEQDGETNIYGYHDMSKAYIQHVSIRGKRKNIQVEIYTHM